MEIKPNDIITVSGLVIGVCDSEWGKLITVKLKSMGSITILEEDIKSIHPYTAPPAIDKRKGN